MRDETEVRLRLQGAHVSKTHGLFVASCGVVHYADLGSRYGTLLLPARGQPRKVEPMKLVPLWVGDAVALGGGEIPPAASAEHAALRMHVFRVLSLTAAPAQAAALASAPAGAGCETGAQLLSATACPVCQDPMLAARVLPCGHAFCADCIARWFRERSTCPSCRASCDEQVLAAGGAACVQLDEVTRALVRAHGDEPTRDRFDEHEAAAEMVRNRKRKAGASGQDQAGRPSGRR